MKKKDVEIGGIYQVRVGQWLVRVRITGESRYGGWDAVNLRTNRAIRIRSAQRLRKRFDAPKTDATPTNVVAPVAPEPAVGANGAEERGDAALPTVVAHAETQTTGQEGDETMGKKQSKKQGGKVSKKAIKAQAKAEGLCPACGRTIRLPNGRGRCECGQAVFARGGKLLRINETPPGCVDLPAATTLEQPKAPEPQPKAKRERADGKMSGLDAAAKVLAETGKPMNCEDMVKLMLEDGLWATEGKTPAATIYAAIIREIAKKGDASRFRKTDRGMFTVAK